MMAPQRRSLPAVWRHGERVAPVPRDIPEETPLALTFNRETYAVMMGTPADLEDFAIGFALTEGIVARAGEIAEFDVLQHIKRSDLPGRGDDSLGQREADGEILQIGRRAHHHRVGLAVEGDGERGFLRHVARGAGHPRAVAPDGRGQCAERRGTQSAASARMCRLCSDCAAYWRCHSLGPLLGVICTAVTLYSGQLVAQSE